MVIQGKKVAFVLITCAYLNIYTQSLIVGIPSSKAAQKYHLEMTHLSQWNFWDKPRKWSNSNFFCFGIGYNSELTIIFNNITNKGSDNLAIGIGAKKVFLLKKEKNIFEHKFTVGSNLLYSTVRKKMGVWAYSHYSFRIPVIHTRLTAGFNYGQSQIFGFQRVLNDNNQFILKPRNKITFIGGFEQPIVKDFSVIGDWYSGTHDLAAFIIAAQIDIWHNVLILGYKIPNNKESGNDALIVEFMISIPSDRPHKKKKTIELPLKF